jgi:hypothetical protein
LILSLGYEKTGPGRRILAAAGGVAGRPHRVGRLLGLQPVGAILLFDTLSLACKLYPPETKESPEVPTWARAEQHTLGEEREPDALLEWARLL